MQLFYFVLKAGPHTIPDKEGQELSDQAAARQHAVAVAQQLMRNRELDTRLWRIQVLDDYLQPLFETCFAEVDETLTHSPFGRQAAITDMARMKSGLDDTVARVHDTLAEVLETLSRADRLLATIPGRRAPPHGVKSSAGMNSAARTGAPAKAPSPRRRV